MAATLPGMAREEAFALFEAYRASEAALFAALLSRYVRVCKAHGAALNLVLLPGRLAMVSPQRDSAHV